MSWSAFRDAKTRLVWRELLLVRQDGCCAICGHRFPQPGELNPQMQSFFSTTFDHIVPRSDGGSDDLDNFRLVHGGCNRARGNGKGVVPMRRPLA